MNRKVDELLQDAHTLLEKALEEFNEGLSKNDKILIRDAAEKAWNAVVQATNALILKLVGKLPMSHYERRVILRELEKRIEEIKNLGLKDRYMARYKILHGETFYEGIIDIEELKSEFEKVKEYVNIVEKLIRELQVS